MGIEHHDLIEDTGIFYNYCSALNCRNLPKHVVYIYMGDKRAPLTPFGLCQEHFERFKAKERIEVNSGGFIVNEMVVWEEEKQVDV